jgi:hypothetical protein
MRRRDGQMSVKSRFYDACKDRQQTLCPSPTHLARKIREVRSEA